MSLAILADQYLGCCVRQVFDPLLTAEVKLHPDSLVVGVEKAVGVAAEAMHVAIGTRNAALTHDDGDLMQGLGQQRPEVPVVVGAAHTGTRIALDRVVEVRKAQRVTEKEHRRIVAYHIPVAFLGVEFQGEAADVALSIGCAALTGDSRETGEHRGLPADSGKDLRFGVAADVMGRSEEHTSELQSPDHLVCRLLLEKKTIKRAT